jgi:uncharacterized protein involved in exopolysaccharide biosynthesis
MQGNNPEVNDEIDLRGLIHSLLKYKWWILGVALAVAIATFLVSEFGAGKSYQAKALLVFGQPVFNLNANPQGLTNASVSLSSLPDSKGITDLAVVDDMLYSIYQSPDAAQSRAQGLSFGAFKQKLSASLSGTNQLLLQVTDPNAERAAAIANLWADAMANRLNELYGSSNPQVTALEKQTADAQKAWEAAEQTLVDHLSQSKVDALTAQLTQQQIAYNSQLGQIHNIDLLLSNARSLDGRLSAQQPTAALMTGDSLGLLTLQQQAMTVLVCNMQAVPGDQTATTPGDTSTTNSTPPSFNCTASNALSGLQIQVSGSNASAEGTVAVAQQQLKAFVDSLTKQQTELKGGMAQMDQQLSDLHKQWESAQFELNKLTDQRDLAKQSYETVSGELSTTRVEVAANGQVARVAGRSIPSLAPTSRVAVNTVVAGLGALLLTAFICFLIDWWRGFNGAASN